MMHYDAIMLLVLLLIVIRFLPLCMRRGLLSHYPRVALSQKKIYNRFLVNRNYEVLMESPLDEYRPAMARLKLGEHLKQRQNGCLVLMKLVVRTGMCFLS